MATNSERRSGKERRMEPPICKIPCKPIVDELSKIEIELKNEVKERDEATHKKLDAMSKCIEDKVPSRLFWKLTGGASVMIFLVFGAMMWDMKTSISDLDKNISVMAVSVNSNSESLKTHLDRSERTMEKIDERLDKIERGETYYNFYEKENASPSH